MRTDQQRRAVISVFSGLCLCFSGLACTRNSDRPKVVKVSGIVQYNSVPLADATIDFIPISGRPANATTGAAGEFALTTFSTGDGAIIGEHVVVVQKYAKLSGDNPYQVPKSLIPEKYNQLKVTPLKVNVPDSGTSNLVIDLAD